ncbi:MAG: Coenzyme F420 hydrogenase/dehydrogenase, beta subunit C-terminal domain [Candidatus Bathyarchaeota archaeon]|nr:MAG: Coenzyme F420 hydrogenase/dehydrogenase, beta subunit C-terminal domain [Candidatus Bathyarchaeota archaeon]
MSERPKIFGHLMTDVIRKGTCVSCGACAAVCPVNSIELRDGTPTLVGLCVACQMCYWNCPIAVFDVTGMEEEVFGRARTEEEAAIGVHQTICAVQAKDGEILGRAQDGGAVSAILCQFLADGGDGAVVTGVEDDRPWAARPLVVSSKEEVLKGAGTKYTSSPTLVGVGSAVYEYAKEKIAVVGTPCQMRGLRKIETGDRSDARIKDAVALRIGVFCMETFAYPSFMEYLKKEGVDASIVDKFEIKSGRFIAHQEGEVVHDVKLGTVKELVRACCHTCGDFTAEFSDLSVGNVGSPDGWSTVIVRNEIGEKILKAAEKNGLVEVKPVEDGKSGLGIIRRLSKRKKKNAEKSGGEA